MSDVTAPGMFSPVERMLARRYLRTRRQGRTLSFTATISLIGIGLGVAALIIVMSVMNGMRHDVLSHILGVDPHVRIERPDGSLKDYDALVRKAAGVPGVVHAMPAIDGDVMVVAQGRSAAATARGVKPADLLEHSAIGRHLVAGSFGAGPDEVVMGDSMALGLGVAVGSEVTLVTPNPQGAASDAVPKSKAFRVAALFAVDNDKYDNNFVYLPLETAQHYFALSDAVTSVDLTVADPEAVAATKAAIVQAVGPGYRVRDWQDLNSAFVSALKVERIVVFILLMLIVLVAAFNIVSGQVMLVKDKGREIAILRTMGATRPAILRIFFMSGASTGVFGTVFGLALGLLVSRSIERIGGWLPRIAGDTALAGVIDFLSRLPAIIDYSQVALVVAMALALSFLAPLYPAWRAARLDPVEALRYE
ncbi:MAG TPA: lipoprotein-releasing ABC transporter permease subunit [Candidatus Acidoferrum sp.]|nr:lipoprotein-releasing ABC transporter permease subunit [Candidatus Acidoferrum sp.]